MSALKCFPAFANELNGAFDLFLGGAPTETESDGVGWSGLVDNGGAEFGDAGQQLACIGAWKADTERLREPFGVASVEDQF